jgi:hypothetical protein
MQCPVLTHVELPLQSPLLYWQELTVAGMYVRNAASSFMRLSQLPVQYLPPGYGLVSVYPTPQPPAPTQSMPNEYSLPAVTAIGGLNVKL